MTENPISFMSGDWIVHRFYGVGQVVGIDHKQLDGEIKKYFKVKTSNSVYWLPIHADPDHVRPISSSHTFRNALTVIRRMPKKLHSNYKQRQKMISDRLAEGTLISKARLIRDLAGRGRQKELNTADRDMLEKLKRHFCREMAIAMDCDESKAQVMVSEAIETSAAKISQ